MTAIEFNNISKQYRLGLVSTRTLSHDLNRWWTMNVRGKDDPYLKIGDTNDRSTKGESDYVWALRDIDFKVEQGDVLGIIGKNGAGKSTLLKILSKVTTPTTGTIKARGRIASLLEVGTGFHPEMTGRENIYMNGAIMGMTKTEITRKLDEIVDFAGVERYIDTPVKRYSSGMMVRLGFAVAAHLDPEILVVDEVLAVGDAEFQKKAIGKMQDVSRGEGRTVLFVSHNMASIRSLCQSGVVLSDGMVSYIGSVEESIALYFKESKIAGIYNSPNDKVVLSKVIIGDTTQETTAIKYGDTLEVSLYMHAAQKIEKPCFWLGVAAKGGSLWAANSLIDGRRLPSVEGDFVLTYRFPKIHLLSQEYYLTLGGRTQNGEEALFQSMEIGSFNVISAAADIGLNGPLAERLIPVSSPILRQYEVLLNQKSIIKFDPNKI